MTHELKCWPEYFRPIIEGRKRFEYRLDDRGYKVGDRLTLREWLPGQEQYTGHIADVQVTYVLIVGPTPQGAPYYVVMSIELLSAWMEAPEDRLDLRSLDVSSIPPESRANYAGPFDGFSFDVIAALEYVEGVLLEEHYQRLFAPFTPKQAPATTHIEREGPLAGMPGHRRALCGNRHVKVWGGVAVADCIPCLKAAFRRGDFNDIADVGRGWRQHVRSRAAEMLGGHYRAALLSVGEL